ncbi:putative ABC transport system permease protein [Geodermatophilus amargosae]|uniref:Putative ABC transport system permease protein n=1 Tax=Geodermatophilus amargosae TaxID=1296565 RepID=A0A1I7BIR9_9ACTN|nr:FtsX-like permease family protein [Geodermatophilus amargosae]SFT87074.1 putative ABC transport system permease protein [Geodermatophilus amargosae]
MWRLSLSNALAHRSRLALTWLAVALGVAFVAGSLVLTDTSTRLLDEQFRTTAAGVDLTVRGAAAFDAAMGVEVARDPLPADLAERVAGTAGVDRVRPVASGPGQLQVRGTAVEPAGPTILGTWAEAPFTAYTLRAGHAPHGEEVVLDAATAADHGIAVGDTVTVSATASRPLRVVGLTGIGDGDGLTNSTVVLVDLPTAQTLLDLGSGVTAVDVIAADGVAVPDLRADLAAALGAQYAVTGGQDAAAASADAAKESINYLRIVLLALAAAGLVVGAFLIANTFGIVLTHRARELALLRAAGATGRQVLGLVLGEALLVGLTGAAGGTAVGVGAAYALRGFASSAGLALPDGPLTVTVRTLVVGLVAGTLITLLAALGPARRAARTAPVEAMRVSDPAPAGPRRGRLITGWILLGLGVVQLGTAALLRQIVGVGLGAVLLLAALVVLGPVLAPRLAQAVGRPLTGLGVPGQLARESIVRNPRRTAATAMALALGLALISFVAVLGSSVKAIGASSTEAITADLLVQSSRDEMLGGLSPEVAARVAALPEVAATSSVRFGHWLDGDMTSALTAVDPATLPQVADVQMTGGALAALDGGGVVLAADVAAERGLTVGDTLAMTFSRDGEQRLRVVGLMADDSARALSTSYVLSLGTYAQHFSENVDATVYVALADGVGPAAARTALRAAVADFPNAEVLDQAEAAAGRAAAVGQVLGLITVLLGFAVLIALLGITNTLALSIVERTREIGLLRAVGMTRAQLSWMVRAEAVLIAAVAVVTGVALGLGLAAATLAGLSADNALVIEVPVGQLLAVVATAVLAGLVAGLLPARRAARLDVLTAIATQ